MLSPNKEYCEIREISLTPLVESGKLRVIITHLRAECGPTGHQHHVLTRPP